MKNFIRILSVSFVVVILFALCALSFTVSAVDSVWDDINGLTFVFNDIYDLSKPVLTNFSFRDPYSNVYSAFNTYVSYISYTQISPTSRTFTAYRDVDRWLNEYYKTIYITSIDTSSISYSETVSNLKENSQFVYSDLYDLTGLTFQFFDSLSAYVADGEYVYNLIFQSTTSSTLYTSIKFVISGLSVSVYGLPENYVNWRQLYYGFWDQHFSHGEFYVQGGSDLEDDDLISFLLSNGYVSGYQQGSGNRSNLLEDSSESGYDVFVTYNVSDIPSGSSTSSSYRLGFDLGTNISFVYEYFPVDYGNYYFDGWYLNSNFTNKVPTVGSSTQLLRDTTLYGRYVYRPPTYTIDFDSNGGSSVTPLVNKTTIPFVLPLSTRYGYVFTGWYTDAALQDPVVAGSSLDSNITLYAGWQFVPGTDIYVDPGESLRGMFTGLTESFLTAFLTISSQIGFGGITLLSVLSTVLVILLIYYVVRVIRG